MLINYVQEVSGNILGFALTTLESLMHHHVGWEKLDDSFLLSLIPFVSSSNLTASRRAIEIITHLVKSPKHVRDLSPPSFPSLTLSHWLMRLRLCVTLGFCSDRQGD